MIEELDLVAKRVGNQIIDISALLDAKAEKWSDTSKRPNGLSVTECVGFINKETAISGLNLVVDIQAPDNKNKAVLRTWAIESTLDNDKIERFNNIQLDFAVSYPQASVLAKEGSDVTRDDIRKLLSDQNTQLKHVIVSNQSGISEASKQPLGERYDLTLGEPSVNKDTIGRIISTLDDVLLIFKKSAVTQGNS